MSGDVDSVDRATSLVQRTILEHSHEVLVYLSEDRSVLRALLEKNAAGVTFLNTLSTETGNAKQSPLSPCTYSSCYLPFFPPSSLGTRLELEDDTYIGKNVKIIGKAEQCAIAERKLAAFIKIQSGPPIAAKGEVVEEIELGKAVGSVVGRSGSNITRLQNENSIKIKIKNSTCYLVGPKAGVLNAKSEIGK